MKLAIGVDIGGTNLRIGVVNEKGRILGSLFLKTLSEGSPEENVIILKNGVLKLLRNLRIDKEKILGIGIGVAGIVEQKYGIVYTSPNLPKWKDVPLKNLVKKCLKFIKKIEIDNDANVVLLGEMEFGAARGAENVVLLTVGTGVGGAIALRKKLYRGSEGNAGEIGHMTIDFNGPECKCGNKGCLERYVGAEYLIEKYKKLGGKVKRDISVEKINMLANQGEFIAKQVFRDAGRCLGIAIANIVNIFNPEKIVIAGGISGAGVEFYRALRASMRERAFERPGKLVRVVRGSLSEKAGVLGSAQLIFHEVD